MREEDILNEIRRKCQDVELLPSVGWYFIYNKRHFLYMSGKDAGMMRFCIPHLVKAGDYDENLLSKAINKTNQEVKFVKVVKLDCGSISLGYDHKILSDDVAEIIVPHIIKALDFASAYFLNKLNAEGYF